MSQKSKNQSKKEPTDYYYLQSIESCKRQLKMLLSPGEYKLAIKYENVMIAESLADATRCKQMDIILSLTRLMSKKSWMSLTQDDIDNLISQVMRIYGHNGQETNTTYDHKKIFKIYFRWLKLGDRSFRNVGNPPEVKNVKLKQVKDKLVREDMITETDIANMLSVCDNLRDKAFLHVHYEAGTRPGEILSLKLKHVTSDKYGMKIAVDGKTGARPVRLVESVPNLSKWIANHPMKDDPESPLWIIFEKLNYGNALTHASAVKILRKVCIRAQITKKINLKLFRHSEATRTATYMTEATLRKRHGWSPTSKMPSKYAHIVQKDVEDAVLTHYGIKQEDEKISKIPIICPVCKNPNSFDAEMCDNCSKPLSIEKAIELEQEEKKEKDSIQERFNKQDAQNMRMEQALANLTKKLDAVLDKDN